MRLAIPLSLMAATTTTTTAAAAVNIINKNSIKDNIEWLHNVKVASSYLQHNNKYMNNIINDIKLLCDAEFEGDNVMEEKIIRHNGWRLSIAILPSVLSDTQEKQKEDDNEVERRSVLGGFMVYRIDGSKRELHIGEMAVVAEYRGMGVGGAAIRILKDMAKSPKCPVDRLVCSSLPGAIKFYKKNGFRKVQKVDNIIVVNNNDEYIEGQWRMEWIVRSKCGKRTTNKKR
mmetsp:Transcript_28110/g.24060  ORF Transcript_28110/g.24060 Transcript_28110/m.24060 type:complete len:230 (-) Transcript_28110:184-873(-)